MGIGGRIPPLLVIFIFIQLVFGVPVFLAIHFVHVVGRSVFCRAAEPKVT
jgi:hypothetical protein